MSSDVFSEAKRSEIMRRVRARDTGPEMALRMLLTRWGLRYRLHRSDLPGSPDIVFSAQRVALFVHGCFWHGHDCRRGDRQPKANAEYWTQKIARNRARDAAAEAALEMMGWRPIIVWECELRHPEQLTRRLATVLPVPDRLIDPAAPGWP